MSHDRLRVRAVFSLGVGQAVLAARSLAMAHWFVCLALGKRVWTVDLAALAHGGEVDISHFQTELCLYALRTLCCSRLDARHVPRPNRQG